MSRKARIGIAALMAASAAAGWALGARWTQSRSASQPAAAAAATTLQAWTSTALGPPRRSIVVLDDGLSPAMEDQAHSTAFIPEASEADESATVDPASLVSALREGGEDERIEALTAALQLGVDLPPDVLRQTLESDPSERLRMLAFGTYLDTVSDDVDAIRDVLRLAAANQSGTVRDEAHRRTMEFERLEESRAMALPQGEQ